MAFEGDEWEVVGKSRKKGGKVKKKQTAPVLEDMPIDSPKEAVRKSTFFAESPSLQSVRSGASTKDTETSSGGTVSPLDSPALASSWSETSTDVPPTTLFELTEESCSLQPSSSGASLEAATTLDTLLDTCERRQQIAPRQPVVTRSRDVLLERKASEDVKHHAKKKSASGCAEIELDEPLGSVWLQSGTAGEWFLVNFQPLWKCASADGPHAPVSVKAIEVGRLVIKGTFLNLEPMPCNHQRARSLDPRILRKR